MRKAFELQAAYRQAFESLEQRTFLSASTPFTGTPLPLPGVIPAQDYDNGGPSVAYTDPDPVNHAKTFRPTEEISLEPSSAGGYDIGYAFAGETLNYTVSVATTGTYTLNVKVASQGPGGTFHFNVDGTTATKELTIPDTGGWQNYTTISDPAVSLTAGTHILQLHYDTGGKQTNFVGNIVAFTATANGTSPSPTPTPTTPTPTPVPTPTPTSTMPFGGTPATAPGVIQAENYDLGGEGVAYHDDDAVNLGGQYRPTEGVDVQATNDVGGGYNVGWTFGGEYLNYTVNVTTTGVYALNFRVSSPGPGGSFHMNVDGVNATGELNIPGTGDWQVFTTVSKAGVSLTAGTHVFRLVMDDGPANDDDGFVGNFNWFSVTTSGSSPSPTPTPSPTSPTTPTPTPSPTSPTTPTPTPTGTAPFIGIGLPGLDYYDPNDEANAVPGQIGQFGAGYQSVSGVPLANGTITQNASYYSDFSDYANGQYTVQFNAPNPAGITVQPAFDLTNLTNVQVSGTMWTGTLTLTHDSGGITAGAGMINISGISASNPVSNFTVYAQGTNPSAFTTTYQNLVQNYASVYTLNTDDVVGNQNVVDAGDLPYNGDVDNDVSVADLVTQTNSLPHAKTMLLELPLGITNAALKVVGQELNGLKAGVQVLVATSAESWNGAQPQFEGVLNQAKANPAVANAASDDFTRVAYQTAVDDINAVQQIRAVSTNPGNVTAYLVSQGSNTYFVDREKSFITTNMGLQLSAYVQYQGISFYPDDNLTSAPSSAQALYNSLVADLPRQVGFLKADKADATASGLHELIYEWGVDGALTQSGISAAVINAFNNSTLGSQWVTQEVQATDAVLGAGDGFEVFSGGLWGPDPDTAAPLTNVMQTLNTFLIAQNT